MINPNGLLFIEPKGPVSGPVEDELTTGLAQLMPSAAEGCWSGERFLRGSGWRGWHTCCCGANSTGYDYLLPGGQVTNSLAVHYLRNHRSEVPERELAKVREALGLASS